MVHVATGVVSTLYVNEGGCSIKLSGVGPPPKDSYFRLDKTHDNYNAIYSLVLGAAMNRYPVQIRTVAEFSTAEQGRVQYVVVDW